MLTIRFLLKLLLCTAVWTASTRHLRAQEIAFTWDDVPAHGPLPQGETREQIANAIIAAMKAAQIPPVYGFVNGGFAEREPASAPVFQIWRNAQLLLGNHTWSHMNINSNSLEDWEAEVLKNEPLLESYMRGADWRWLRFPFLAEGNTPEKRQAARKFLAEHHYRIAAVTMSFSDYAYNEPYARCVASNDEPAIQKLETSYLQAADNAVGYSRAMAKALYGRDIPYVLLMHIGAFDARMLPRLLELYQRNGIRFVRLEDAEKDPFYRNDLDPSLPATPDTLEEAMRQRSLPMPKAPQPGLDLDKICR